MARNVYDFQGSKESCEWTVRDLAKVIIVVGDHLSERWRQTFEGVVGRSQDRVVAFTFEKVTQLAAFQQRHERPEIEREADDI